jgi:TolA-binding protein
MREVDDELQEIKREIIESRGLVIRTNNLTNALSADIKSIAKRQQGYERRLAWNSATAYIVFVVVVFAALKFAVDARVDAIEAKYQHLGAENARLKKVEEESKAREADRAAVEMEAAKFYDLVRQNKRADLVRAYETIKQRPLTKAEQALFADAVERAKNEQTTILYLQGLESVRLQRWQDAASLFEEALRYKDDSPIAPEVRLELAGCYRKLKRQRDAIPILSSLTEQGIDKDVQDDAYYLLAQCDTDIEAWNDAKTAWRALLRKFPDSHYAQEGKLALQQLQQQH